MLGEPFSAVDEELGENLAAFLGVQIPVMLITHVVRGIATLQTEVVYYKKLVGITKAKTKSEPPPGGFFMRI